MPIREFGTSRARLSRLKQVISKHSNIPPCASFRTFGHLITVIPTHERHNTPTRGN